MPALQQQHPPRAMHPVLIQDRETNTVVAVSISVDTKVKSVF